MKGGNANVLNKGCGLPPPHNSDLCISEALHEKLPQFKNSGPYTYNHGQIHCESTEFYLLKHFVSHILGSFATPSPPHSLLLGGNEGKIVCRADQFTLILIF